MGRDDHRAGDREAGGLRRGRQMHEFDAVAGQVTALPSGYDAWVVGDEPVVVVDWWGASDYARGE